MNNLNEMLGSLSNLTDSYWWEKKVLDGPTIDQLAQHDLIACSDGCGQYGAPGEMFYDEYSGELYISKAHYLRDRELMDTLKEN